VGRSSPPCLEVREIKMEAGEKQSAERLTAPQCGALEAHAEMVLTLQPVSGLSLEPTQCLGRSCSHLL
jgi:hypothetical protein